MLECSQRDRLTRDYLRAVNAYGEALSLVKSLARSSDPISERHVTQQRHEACQLALRAFLDHVKEHRCNET